MGLWGGLGALAEQKLKVLGYKHGRRFQALHH